MEMVRTKKLYSLIFYLEITCEDPEVIQLVDEFTKLLLIYSKDLDFGFSKVKDCSCGTIYLYKAIVNIFVGQIKEAKENLEKSKKFQMNEREEMNLRALEFWTQGKSENCIQELVSISKKFPTDLVAIFICFQHFIFGGRMKELLKLIENIVPFHENNSYVLGMYCFGLEECQKFEKAEEMGLKANKINEMDPWYEI